MGDFGVWEIKLVGEKHILEGKGSISAPFQHLKINGTTNNFNFDDKTIARGMESVHIHRSNTDASSFDDKFREETEAKLEQIISDTNNNQETWHEEPYNKDICNDEVKTAIGATKDDSAPGPDKVHPLLITRAGWFMVTFMTDMFQTFWSRGEFPSPFKRGNIIYLPKPGKETYSTEKAWRPICLTDIAAKIYERIIARRLIAHLRSIVFFYDTQSIRLPDRFRLRASNIRHGSKCLEELLRRQSRVHRLHRPRRRLRCCVAQRSPLQTP